MKYRVGDRVRLVGDGNSTRGKREHFGKIATIKDYHDGEMYPYRLEEGTGYRWRESEFEPVKKDKIVITNDGKTTTAILYREDGTKEKATAKCSPEDTFDFNVGANLAMERLMEKVNPPKPKYYDGKVVCVMSSEPDFTAGKIYTFVDGTVKDNFGHVRYECTGRIKDLSQIVNLWKFIPYVE